MSNKNIRIGLFLPPEKKKTKAEYHMICDIISQPLIKTGKKQPQ